MKTCDACRKYPASGNVDVRIVIPDASVHEEGRLELCDICIRYASLDTLRVGVVEVVRRAMSTP